MVAEASRERSIFTYPLRLDPRTWLFLLAAANIAAWSARDGFYDGLLFLIFITGLLCGVRKFSLKMAALYAFFAALQELGLLQGAALWQILTATCMMLLQKTLPVVWLAGVMMETVRVNELLAAFQTIRLPKRLSVPLAVALRYGPTVREEWRSIHQALRLRGLSPFSAAACKNPLRVLECVYVPLLIGALQTADELAASAMARGLENPAPRTSFVALGFSMADGIAVALFSLLLAGVVFLK